MSIFKRREKPPEPVKVAWAPRQSEAEMISGILESEGIPCLVRRSEGFDIPYLAGGARSIYVPASAAERAKEILDDLKSGEESLPGS